MKSPMRRLAVVACLAASLTACELTTPRHVGGAGLTTATSPGHAHAPAGCPLGRLVPDRGGIAIDYVDFLRFDGQMYVAGAEPIKAGELGRVITHVRCSLAAEEDQRHAEPPLIDGTASFLAAGTAMYEVLGYAPGCRLAAYLHGRLQVYLAQTTVLHHAAAVPCAAHRVPAGPGGRDGSAWRLVPGWGWMIVVVACGVWRAPHDLEHGPAGAVWRVWCAGSRASPAPVRVTLIRAWYLLPRLAQPSG